MRYAHSSGAGAEALHEHVPDVGYAQLASEFNHRSADAERRAARDRYVLRTQGAVMSRAAQSGVLERILNGALSDMPSHVDTSQ